MLLRFQCSKSTDNPKIYVSSAARQYERTVPVGRRTMIHAASKRNCPTHKGERLEKTDKRAEKVIVDLIFTKTGCRKTVIKHSGEERYCRRCKKY